MGRPKFEDYVYSFETKHNQYEKALNVYIDELQKEIKSLNADRKLLIDSRQELSNRITTLEHENEELKEQINNWKQSFEGVSLEIGRLREENQVLEKALELLYKGSSHIDNNRECALCNNDDDDNVCMRCVIDEYKGKAKEELEVK